jgi:hypothetical protein
LPGSEYETRNPAKLALMIGNKDQFANDRLCRDQRIQRTNGCAGTLKPRPNLRIRSCVAGGKFQDGDRTKEIFCQPQRLRRRTALGRAGPQLGFGNDANRNVFRGPSEQVFSNCQILFEGIDAGIGVEEEFHRSEVRFSASPCGGRLKSSATPANDSAYP